MKKSLLVFAGVMFTLLSCNKKNNTTRAVSKTDTLQHRKKLPPRNLDPDTKFNIVNDNGVGRRYVNLNDDGALIEYLRYAPFGKFFSPDSNGTSGQVSLKFNGAGTQYDPLRYFFLGISSGDRTPTEGNYRFAKKIYDNSRTIYLIPIPNNFTINHDTTSSKKLNIKLFNNGTLMVKVKDLTEFFHADVIANDTSKYWTLDK